MKALARNIKLVILIVLLTAIILVHRLLTSSWLPINSDTTFVFTNLVLMIVLGSLLLEDKFTKPADAFVNGILVLITLFAIRDPQKYIAWSANVTYAAVIVLLALITMVSVNDEESSGALRNRFARLTYKLSTFFGRSNLLFSVTFVLSVFSFYSSQQRDFLILMLFWAGVVVIQPLGIVSRLARRYEQTKGEHPRGAGRVISVTLPGVVRYEPFKDTTPRVGELLVLSESDVARVCVVTEYYRVEEKVIAQAVTIQNLGIKDTQLLDVSNSGLYRVGTVKDLAEVLSEKVVSNDLERFVGVVIDNSTIGEIVFKLCGDQNVEEGNILEVTLRGQKVLFQIVNGKTDTETLSTEIKAGLTKGIAQQIGVWNAKSGCFEKYGWVAPTHTPLFLVGKDTPIDYCLQENEVIIGHIPGTQFPVVADASVLITHHTAILGITGSGKTEMAYTLIEKMAELKTKVLCVDFTGDYLAEFASMSPQVLAISEAEARELNDKLFEAETGEYGAGAEKKALNDCKTKLLPVIKKLVEDYVSAKENIAILELSDIANTSATIAITEMFLNQVFGYARKHRKDGPQFCIVLEEAHTVVPESQTMGAQDKFSKETISKICQIALQGRKYNVGLLVIGQRTANIAKTVLNQCNSIIIFNSYDKTGFDFFENYIGTNMTAAIPNLKYLQSIVAGRGFRTKQPIIVEIPFKEKYKK